MSPRQASQCFFLYIAWFAFLDAQQYVLSRYLFLVAKVMCGRVRMFALLRWPHNLLIGSLD